MTTKPTAGADAIDRTSAAWEPAELDLQVRGAEPLTADETFAIPDLGTTSGKPSRAPAGMSIATVRRLHRPSGLHPPVHLSGPIDQSESAPAGLLTAP